MAVKTQSDAEINVDAMSSEELEALQAILAAQGESVSYKEVADIGYELLGFFEALGEENISNDEDAHA
jgi:hypothetical protein